MKVSKVLYLCVCTLVMLALVAGVVGCKKATPTPTPTPAPTVTTVPTATPVPIATPTKTASPTVTATATATATAPPTPAPTVSKTYELISQCDYPSTHHVNIQHEAWIKEVETRSGGKIKIKNYPGSQLVPAKESIQALQKGTLDILASFANYFSGIVPAGDIALLPFGIKNIDDCMDIYYNTEFAKINDGVFRKAVNSMVIGINFYLTEPILMRKGNQVKTIDDLKGKKIRGAGGMINEAIKVLGAAPVSTIAGEIYTAMQTGVVDGAVFPTYGLETYKLIDVVESITMTSLASALFIQTWMNLDSYNKMEPAAQQVLLDAEKARRETVRDYSKDVDAKYLKVAKEKGLIFNILSDEDEARARKAIEEQVYKWYLGRSGEDGKKMFDIVFAYNAKKYGK